MGTDIIAPFFADANSDNGGGITLYGATTFEGYSAFVAEWPGVDCYTDDGTASDVDNDFEVILINRPDLWSWRLPDRVQLRPSPVGRGRGERRHHLRTGVPEHGQ